MLCNYCPRKCNSDRSALPKGWCRLDDKLHIASICLHYGEEPPLSGQNGIVNVFFEHCNLQCIYCQNYEISDNTLKPSLPVTLDEVCNRIEDLLPASEGNLGFVSPSHCIPQMLSIINELHTRGIHPVIVYNSNGYDNADTIRSLDGVVDVWLPDFKYSDDTMGEKYSMAPDYSTVALAALKEMVNQCGTTLQTNERGIATHGVIIRHLVLPGAADNSIGVLKLIAEEISPNIHISLMSQYYPTEKVIKNNASRNPEPGTQNPEPRTRNPELLTNLLRPITKEEYEKVLDAFYSFGFHRGWLQDYESRENYRPDFSKENPFE